MREHREVVHHSFSYSQIQTLCSTKSSRETLQNLPHKVPYAIFSQLRQTKEKKWHIMKKGRNIYGFLCKYNMANFEAFRWSISLGTNYEIGKSASSSSFTALMLLFLMHKCLAGQFICTTIWFVGIAIFHYSFIPTSFIPIFHKLESSKSTWVHSQAKDFPNKL